MTMIETNDFLRDGNTLPANNRITIPLKIFLFIVMTTKSRNSYKSSFLLYTLCMKNLLLKKYF